MIRALVVVATLLSSSTARAHGFAPAVVRLDEHAAGVFSVAESEPGAAVISAPSCAREGAVLRCGPDGLLRATVTAHAEGEVFVRVSYRDGEGAFRALPAGESFAVPPRGRDDRGASSPWWFAREGVVHLALGHDHLLFLAMLVASCRAAGALAASVTTFSLAHMASLALLAAGALSVPQPPVEACIALSIVSMAVAARRGTSWLARRPALAVAPLGLLHGLGFGAALAEAGLPRERLVASILAFHAGIELGQLAFALALFFGLRALGDRRDRWVERGSILVGALGCAITLQRALALGT